MLGLTGFLGLTRIPLGFWAHTDLTDPTLLLCGWEISQMLLCVGGSCGFHFAFGLTRISQIPRYCFVGGKSHRCFCVWAGSRGFHFAFGLTRISQIPRCCFVGGKSHRWLCGCGLLGAARGSLSRTYLLDPSDKSDLSDKSDGLDIFKNNP